MGAIPRPPCRFRRHHRRSSRPHGCQITRQGDVASVSAVISSNLVWAVARGLGLRRLGRLHWPGSSGAVLIWVWLFRWCWLVASRSGRGVPSPRAGCPIPRPAASRLAACGFVPPAGRAGLSVRCGTYPDAGSECQKFPVLKRAGCGIPRSVRGPWSGKPVDDREVTYSWSPEPRVIADPGPELSRGCTTASLWSS